MSSTNAPRPNTIVDLHDIPVGHYQAVMESGHPIRRAWHLQKFGRVLECLPDRPGQSILDVGCFAGSFLSLCPRERFSRQVGVDILPEQVEYANKRFGTDFRRFQYAPSIRNIGEVDGQFDCVTMIEVIEHLTAAEIPGMIEQITAKLRPGGRLVMSTPNYTSTWPILEQILNRVSDISYAEQHATRFTFFDARRKLEQLAPQFRTDYDMTLKTTTHFISPFLAVFGVGFASRVSRAVSHGAWKFPFGNLLLVAFDKKR
ncbi:MAG: methyltransferase domain-containing protein [Planctomycetota bacterium]|nr:methyltransferase domain-containing protein [Planctomycetota bacterium]